jgi:anti-anti-sigma factor
MKIENAQEGSVFTLRPRGALAGAEAEALKGHFEQLTAQGPAQVVLDCSGVRFVDSRGLEVLVEMAEHLIREGRSLKLSGVNPTLKEVLDLTELAPLFQLVDVPEAKTCV